MAWQRSIPFGYAINNGELAVVPREAEAVRDIFTRYLAGESYSEIAAAMTKSGVLYHPHTTQWNKHMVKRILDNESYLGNKSYPRLIEERTFLAAHVKRQEKTEYKPCPAYIIPFKAKATCSQCEGRMCRDTFHQNHPCWQCQSCGVRVYLDDESLYQQVTERLQYLLYSPELLTPCPQQEADRSSDAIRIQNEITLCFNRQDLNVEYIRTLIFAAAAEQYTLLPDESQTHDLLRLQARIADGQCDLHELLSTAVSTIRIGKEGVALELINRKIVEEAIV